jgi:hypothetical protein
MYKYRLQTLYVIGNVIQTTKFPIGTQRYKTYDVVYLQRKVAVRWTYGLD